VVAAMTLHCQSNEPAIDRVVFMYAFLEVLVANYMTRPVKTVIRQVTMRELNLLFENDDVNAYPVREHDRVSGLITKCEFLSCFQLDRRK
jgi:predicted transcriptional regulator